MKQLNITFEDEDYEKLIELKTELKMGWREFLIYIVNQHKEIRCKK